MATIGSRRAKVFLTTALCLISPMAVGCMSGHIINATTVHDVQAGISPNATKTPANTTKSAPKLPSHLSAKVGLGDTLDFINAHWGKPSKIATPMSKSGTGSGYYVNGTIYIQFHDHRADDITWTPKHTVSLSKAEAYAATMLPKDAKLAETVTITGKSELAEQYTSKTAMHAWPIDLLNGIPGRFTVVYAVKGDHVSSFEISLGENM